MNEKTELIKKILQLENELQSTQTRLVEQFYIDYLSSLPNLYKLRSDMELHPNSILILLNIDNFKILNNFYGFIVGDFILESMARLLKVYFPENNVYRISSDEFAILLKKKMNFYDLKVYLDDLSKEVSHVEFSYSNTKIYVDTTLASSASASSENVFSKVNMALKHAKEEKLKCWIYEDSMAMSDEYENNLKYAKKIRNALSNSGLIPYFQPIIDNKTDKIVKYESLSRLVDNEGMVHSPDNFIPVSKTIKVYDVITKTIIEKTFAAFKDSTYEFSINLSFEDVINQDIFDFIIEKMRNSNISSRVTFELLESEKVKDFDKVIHFFNEIKRYGGKIAIDDFGSGFSNFSYMIKLKPDYIKIDGSLIKDLDTDKNAQIVVETIVSFAKKLGIKTVAEYVHSSTILSAVKSMDIDYSQGFFIDQPSPQLSI